MKKIFLLLLATAAFTGARAQTGISAAGTAADAAAMLDVIATDKGFMVPRVALTALNTAGPVTGLSATSTSLLVYNTATAGGAPNNVTPGFYYWDNATTSWIRILSGAANFVAGNDIDFGTSASGSIDIEPTLNFVHTVSAPATNNLNLNAASGFAAVVNANNGTTGATQTFRIGNGAGGADVFYVQANGTFYSANQAQITSHAIIGGNLGVTGTSSQTGAATFGTSVTISPFATAGIVTNTSAGLLGTTVPGTSGYLLSSSNTGTVTWVNPASLGVKWNAITAPDGALTLNHGTNATIFNFTNTTTTGWAINHNSLTSGTGLALASTATAFTGTLASATLSGSNAANTGTVMKVTNSGALNTGTALMVTNAGTGSSFRVNDDGTDTDATAFIIDAAGAVGIGVAPDATYKLKAAGKLLTSGIDENSDARLKQNINPIYDALSKVTQMRGVTYNWRTEEFPERNFEKDMQFGLIAQELEKVIPELVTTDGDGYKAIEYSHLVPVLIEAIKELKSENDSLKAENSNTVSQLSILNIRMNALENNVENKTNKAEK